MISNHKEKFCLSKDDIEVVMNALAGQPIVTSSDFADKIEFILREHLIKQEKDVEIEIDNPDIDKKKLLYYLKNDFIEEFASDIECMEYFNTYDYQDFKNVEEMKAYQGVYGFNIDEKRYHINYDCALDVYISKQK